MQLQEREGYGDGMEDDGGDTYKEVMVENSFLSFRVNCRKVLSHTKDYQSSECLPLNEAYSKLRGILKKPLNITNHVLVNN